MKIWKGRFLFISAMLQQTFRIATNLEKSLRILANPCKIFENLSNQSKSVRIHGNPYKSCEILAHPRKSCNLSIRASEPAPYVRQAKTGACQGLHVCNDLLGSVRISKGVLQFAGFAEAYKKSIKTNLSRSSSEMTLRGLYVDST